MGSAAAGLGAQLPALAAGEDRPGIHTAGSSIPALSLVHPSQAGKGDGGRERLSGERWEGGGGSDVQLFIW